MKLICKPTDLDMTPDMPDAEIGRIMNQIFMRRSDYNYGWKTESIVRNPDTIRFVATHWNENIKNDFVRLVSDMYKIKNLQLNTAETNEIVFAANAMNDIYNFCGFYHVMEPNDIGPRHSMHTIIHPLTLSQIQAHPENYLLIMGETIIQR